MLIYIMAECSALTCVVNQGTCRDGTCTCNAGFYGQNCSLDYLECNRAKCSGRGECASVLPNYWACACSYDWFGPQCSLSQAYCREQICNAHGQCVNSSYCLCDGDFDASLACLSCRSGFVLIEQACHAEQCVANNSVCSAHGTCESAACKCAATFYGSVCYYDQERCDQELCSAKGECQMGAEGLVCACDEGYAGQNCSQCGAGYVDLAGVCLPAACLRNGTICSGNGNCSVVGEVQFCVCNTSFYGEFCQLTRAECDQQVCSGHGACLAKTAQEQLCNCSSGFSEPLCAACKPDYTMINDSCWLGICVAQGAVCSSAGNCTPAGCSCAEDRFGAVCELNAETCARETCFGNGECVFGVMPLQCRCSSKFLLPYCENCSSGYVNLNGECVLSICVLEQQVCSGHGSCGDFGCTCDDEFFGKYCQQNYAQCSLERCSAHGKCKGSGCECDFPWSGASCSECPREAYQLIDGQCTSNNCVTELSICSNNGICDNTVAACRCNSKFYGKRCEMSQETCNARECSSHGNCTLNGNITSCLCEAQYTSLSCEVCNLNNGYLSGVSGDEVICVRKECVRREGEAICSGKGKCLIDKCECSAGYFGSLCQLDQEECDLKTCGGLGVCLERNNSILCECAGGTLRPICCAIGSIGSQCVTPLMIGLICAAGAAIVLAVAFTSCLMARRQKLAKEAEERMNSKFYSMQEIKTFGNASSNFFYI